MKNMLLLVGLIAMGASMLHAEPLAAIHVDIHDRLYPDRWPKPAVSVAVSVPRGAPVTFQFAVRSTSDGIAKLDVAGDLPGKVRLHWLESVHVEGNTQGSLINRPGGKVPDGWLEHHLVRAAPFDTLEAAIEGDTMSMTADRTHGVVVEIAVPRDTEPGTYNGSLHIALGEFEASAPFAFRVHETVIPEPMPLHSIHWLWAEPVNLTDGEVPEWWSERHWELLEQAGEQLRRFGDDTIFTPLTSKDRGELIQITRSKDGTYAFDYSRFDRWCELFLGLGFRTISGRHILYLGAETYVSDEGTGKRESLLRDPKSKDEWLAFLPTLYDSLHAHLKEKGWLDRYIQCQYDEPSDEKLYRKLAGLARKHMPGIPTCDAINNRAPRFSPLVDTQVFSLLQLNKFKDLATQRNANGQGVWLYHCTSPYPPNPNRHIDSPLTESRLYPWLCRKLGANGFLFWAANGYRGADEYETSIGPFPPPKNNQDPGHPPGDNWFYYRTAEGLQPSLRIFSHREGLIDYALLTELAKHDPSMVAGLVAKIAPSIRQYERTPAKYHESRAAILDALDGRAAPDGGDNPATASQQLVLASWLGDNMILPANRPVPIRGTAAPGTEVTVAFATQKKSTTVDELGKWDIVLEPMSASSQGRKLEILSSARPSETSAKKGQSPAPRSLGEGGTLHNVVVGDTWLCSGQSNMQVTIGKTHDKQAAKDAIQRVEVRYFNGRTWGKVTPRNVETLSAVGVWFAVEMARRQDAPVGLAVAARGGTGIEAWVPEGAFPDTEHGRRMKPLVNDPDVLKAARADARDSRPYGQHRLAKWGLGRAAPASEFERRVRPLADLPIRGVVWYQGESNALATDTAQDYRYWLASLVESWRELFGNSELPFTVIQLPEFDPGTETERAAWAVVQEAQAAVARELDGVWAVDTTGLGDLNDVHPQRKKEMGLKTAETTYRALFDWRDANRSWHGKVQESERGGDYADNAQIVVADDGTWVCAWPSGTHEGSGDMQIVFSVSKDKGRTWSKKKPIEPSTENNTSAYGFLFKSPATGRIFSIYRFHDHAKIISDMKAAGQDSSKTGGHFRDTAGEVAFRYSDDNGQSWSERHFIPTRRTSADNAEGPLCGWFYGIGPVIIDGHVWFTGNKYRANITSGAASDPKKTTANTWETWFWKSPNLHTEKDPTEIIWENKPEGELGIVPDKGVRYWVEASLVSLNDPQKLYCVARNRFTGVLGQSFSTDGGNSWQTPPSAAEYWDGSGELNNPKAGPMLKQLSDGTYLLTFYNDRARADNKVPYWKLFDRSPVWCAVGWPDGNVLKFSQPEILIYTDDNNAATYNGKMSSIYAPFLFEADDKVFTVYSHGKTDVQIVEIPSALIEGMKQQRTARELTTEGLVFSLTGKEIQEMPKLKLADQKFQFGDLSQGDGFAVEFWLEADQLRPQTTMLASRSPQGQGVWIGLSGQGQLEIQLCDIQGRKDSARTAENALSVGKRNHVVVNVDGASDVVTLIVNGVISGDNPRMNYKQLDRALTDIHGLDYAVLGPADHLRIYRRYLTTSAAIANYRAGMAQE